MKPETAPLKSIVRDWLRPHKRHEYVIFLIKIYSIFRTKNVKAFIRVFSTSVYVVVNAIWAIPFVLLIRCLRPWRVVRLGGITADVIGHFVLEVSWIGALKSEQKRDSLDLFYYFSINSLIGTWGFSRPCNTFYAALTERNLRILPAFILVPISIWNRVMPGGRAHHIPSSWERDHFTQDVHGWLQRSGAKLPFSIEENNQAGDWLRRQGLQSGDAYCCLLVRDSCFKGEDGFQKESTIRNSDIRDYVDAVKMLADSGVWVLRMGKKMSARLELSHPRVIDYAFHSERSDFLDIWLFAHCDLCISTGCGPDMVSLAYNRPFLCLNYIPLFWFLSSIFANYAFKKLIWRSSGSPLRLQEYLDNCFHAGSDYAQQGIDIIDLGPNEICAVVEETWQRVQGIWTDSKESQVRQAEFWRVVKSHPKFNHYHGWIHPQSTVSSVWLASMNEEFFKML